MNGIAIAIDIISVDSDDRSIIRWSYLISNNNKTQADTKYGTLSEGIQDYDIIINRCIYKKYYYSYICRYLHYYNCLVLEDWILGNPQKEYKKNG